MCRRQILGSESWLTSTLQCAPDPKLKVSEKLLLATSPGLPHPECPTCPYHREICAMYALDEDTSNRVLHFFFLFEKPGDKAGPSVETWSNHSAWSQIIKEVGLETLWRPVRTGWWAQGSKRHSRTETAKSVDRCELDGKSWLVMLLHTSDKTGVFRSAKAFCKQSGFRLRPTNPRLATAREDDQPGGGCGSVVCARQACGRIYDMKKGFGILNEGCAGWALASLTRTLYGIFF